LRILEEITPTASIKGIATSHRAVTGVITELSILLKYIRIHAHKKPSELDPLSPRNTVLSPKMPKLYIKKPTIAPTGKISGKKVGILFAFMV
tara:strand:+ start:905 stop:1180 length:276 start_codon:yes stop_codon:yes gene_type:complete